MNIAVSAIVGLMCSLIGTGIAIATFSRNRDKDIKSDSEKNAIVATKLDYISKGVDDIRLDIRAQDNKIQSLNNEVIEVRQSVKSAHHRIDAIEERRGEM